MNKLLWSLSSMLLSGCIGVQEPSNAVSDYPTNRIQVKAPISHTMRLNTRSTALITTNQTITAWGAIADNEHLENIASIHGDLALNIHGEIIYLTDNPRLRSAITALDLPPLQDIEYANDGERGIALSRDGRLVSWPKAPPPHVGHFVDIALGGGERPRSAPAHFVALDIDGSLLTWGNNDRQQLNIPDGLGKVVKISAGRLHTIALTESGRVAVWGNAQGLSFCISGCPSVYGIGVHNLPDNLTSQLSAIDIAAHEERNAVLLSDGTVYVWGDHYLTRVFASDGSDREAIAIGPTDGVLVRSDDQITRLESGGGDYLLPPKRENLWEVANKGGYWVDDSGNSHWLGYRGLFSDNAFSEYQNTELTSIIIDDGYLALASNYQLFAEFSHYSTVDGPADTYLIVEDDVISAAVTKNSLVMAKPNGKIALRTLPWYYAPDTFPDWEIAMANDALNSPIKKLISGKLGLETAQVSEVVVALLEDGSIKVWGDNSKAVAEITPTANELIADIRIYDDLLITLKKSGQLIAWGEDAQQVKQHLATLPTIARMATGYHFAIATTGTPIRIDSPLERPSDLKPVIDIQSCRDYLSTTSCTLAIQEDGEIRAWGEKIVTPKYYSLGINNLFNAEILSETN